MAVPLVLAGGAAGLIAELVAGTPKAAPAGAADKARAVAEDFEAVFLHTMFHQMFTGIDGEGPFGGGTGTGIWRSFLSEEYAKTFAKTGGVGIADHVYRSLLALQEARP